MGGHFPFYMSRFRIGHELGYHEFDEKLRSLRTSGAWVVGHMIAFRASSNLTIEHLHEFYGHLACREAQDSVFGLLGMVSKPRHSFKVDYAQSKELLLLQAFHSFEIREPFDFLRGAMATLRLNPADTCKSVLPEDRVYFCEVESGSDLRRRVLTPVPSPHIHPSLPPSKHIFEVRLGSNNAYLCWYVDSPDESDTFQQMCPAYSHVLILRPRKVSAGVEYKVVGMGFVNWWWKFYDWTPAALKAFIYSLSLLVKSCRARKAIPELKDRWDLAFDANYAVLLRFVYVSHAVLTKHPLSSRAVVQTYWTSNKQSILEAYAAP